jgi:hypothetical protein
MTYALFAWLISHQPAVLFSHNKPATSNQPAVLFSQNKPASAISHQPNEQADSSAPAIFFKKKESAVVNRPASSSGHPQAASTVPYLQPA